MPPLELLALTFNFNRRNYKQCFSPRCIQDRYVFTETTNFPRLTFVFGRTLDPLSRRRIQSQLPAVVFFRRVGDPNCEVVACFVKQGCFEIDVNHRVLDAFVTEQLLDVNDVFCLVVFHCGFPVTEGCEAYFLYAWVVEFSRHVFALLIEVCRGARIVEDSVAVFFEGADSLEKFVGY